MSRLGSLSHRRCDRKLYSPLHHARIAAGRVAIARSVLLLRRAKRAIAAPEATGKIVVPVATEKVAIAVLVAIGKIGALVAIEKAALVVPVAIARSVGQGAIVWVEVLA